MSDGGSGVVVVRGGGCRTAGTADATPCCGRQRGASDDPGVLSAKIPKAFQAVWARVDCQDVDLV